MTVLERSELDASPLADLHAIADQIGLDGFRRLRKADLIGAILDRSGGAARDGAEEGGDDGDEDAASDRPASRRRRTSRARRTRSTTDDEEGSERDVAEPGASEE